jgi:type II secretory pathway pseudopilin PulG
MRLLAKALPRDLAPSLSVSAGESPTGTGGSAVPPIKGGAGCGKSGLSPRAFTLVEIMVSLAVFMLIMGSIMGCWKAIVSGAHTGEAAAAMAQRARNSMRAVEDSLNNLEISVQNIRFDAFVADTTDPQFASLSFAARLPASFLGSDYFGDNVMRRVIFDVEKGAGDTRNLVMTQYPVLAIPSDQYPPKSIILARDVSAFVLEFWSPRDEDWLSEFTRTDQVPPMIRITLGTGHLPHNEKIPFEVISRIVVPPTKAH